MSTCRNPDQSTVPAEAPVGDAADPPSRRTFLAVAGIAAALAATGAPAHGMSRLLAAPGSQAAGTGTNSAPSGISRTPRGRGVVTRGTTVEVKQGTDVVVDDIVISPGGTTGWHTHPGPEVLVVRSGVLTFRRYDGQGCVTETIAPGQAFVGADPGQPHVADNLGPQPVEFVVSFFDVPVGGPVRTDVDPPPGCL